MYVDVSYAQSTHYYLEYRYSYHKRVYVCTCSCTFFRISVCTEWVYVYYVYRVQVVHRVPESFNVNVLNREKEASVEREEVRSD